MTNMWECAECGSIEYGAYPPEECSKCWKTNSYVEVPEDVAEQIKDSVLERVKADAGENGNGDDDLDQALGVEK